LLQTSVSFGQWEQLETIQQNSMYDLATANEFTVTTVSEFGQIHHSTDAGQTFELLNAPFSFALMHTIEYRGDIGYIGAGCYFTTQDCPANVIYKTTDGGNSWTLAFQDDVNAGQGVFNSIQIPSNEVAYALNDTQLLYKSIDGGVNWEQANTPSHLIQNYKIQFLNDDIGFLHGSFTGIVPTPIHQILKTTDGGFNYEEVSLPNLDLVVIDFFFADESNGYVITPEFLYKTTDAGMTWSEIAVNLNDGEDLQKLSFANETIGYISSYDELSGSTKIYRSEDAGLTWGLELEAAVQPFDVITSLDFYDGNNGYARSLKSVWKRTGPSNTADIPSLAIRISPNPTSGLLMINNLEAVQGQLTYRVMNLQGKLMSEGIAQRQLDISQLPAGAYFVEIKS